VLNDGTNADFVRTNTGSVYLPKTPEAFVCDADGNMTNDGRWTFTWDAENRLVSMQALSSVPNGAKKKLDFMYDYGGRRTQKIVSTWNGSAYVAQSTNKFLYDGWNLIAELNHTNGLIRSYIWGLDLSGSMQGAGGVGGLLAIKPTGTNTFFVSYDGNGNVTDLIDAATGTTSGQFEYGPFGEVIRATGPSAKANPFRFSTKYTDDETDFLYYGFRYYNSIAGKWPNRDPYGERGGLNLYGFVDNDPINVVDLFGLYTAKVKNCEVVVLYGHGSADKPHTFKFGGRCSAGHFVGCQSRTTNDKIPPGNQIPGAPSTDDDLVSGPGNRDNPDTSFDKFMDDSWAAAKKKAKDICASKDKCCKSVTIRTELAGSAFNPDNWTQPGTKSETIKCDGK